MLLNRIRKKGRRELGCKIAALTLAVIFSAVAAAKAAPIVIGVESSLDPTFFVESFGPAMATLRKTFPQHTFKTEFLSIDGLQRALEEKRLALFFAESGFFAFAESQYGARDLAVRRSPRSPNPSLSASTTVLVRKDALYKRISDLKHARAAAESPESFAGWTILQGMIASGGEDPDDFFSETIFTAGEYPDPETLVAAGMADVAVLKACDLERLMATHSFSSWVLRVLEPQSGTALRCLHSGPLYPDIVAASTPTADPAFVREAAIALLSSQESREGYAWGIGTDFESVATLYRDLKLGPYAYLREANWSAFWANYREWILLFGLLIAFGVLHIIRTNKLVAERTAQLRKTIQEKDALEEEARISRQRLSQIERAGVVSQMSSMLAHEVRQPIAALINFAGGLGMYVEMRYGEDKTVMEAAALITEEAERVSSIVERVRSYAKRSEVRRVKMNVNDLADAAIRSFSHSTTSSGVRIVKTGGPQTASVEVDSLEMELVILNLLKNAAAAVKNLNDTDRRTIEVAWRIEALGSESSQVPEKHSVGKPMRFIVIAVRDRGPRLTDEAIASLADGPVQSMKPDGLGLGLSLCRRIAERHGGSLHFLRAEASGDGLVAEVTIPAVDEEEEKNA